MPWPLVPTGAIGLIAVGALLVAVGVIAARRSGANFRMGRRLAGAPTVAVGDIVSRGREAVPDRADVLVRVAGRVRCRDPIVTPDGERLVALHRTVEAHVPGAGWRPLERIREARVFQLWDHDGQLSIDPTSAAEPLVAIPAVWRGRPDELPADYHAALEALRARAGAAPDAARAETRWLSVVDSLLVVGRIGVAQDGSARLEPPAGGYIISNLPADAALRLLGGGRRHLLVAGVIAVGLGGTLILAALLAVALSALA